MPSKVARTFSQLITRDADPLTYVAAAETLYGNNLLFDLCADDSLAALSLFGSYPQLLDWIGWEMSNAYKVHEYFISYVAASGAAADAPSTGYITDPCAPGNPAEWGFCDFQLTGFGMLRRGSQVRDMGVDDLKYCQAQPRYRIDGTVIDNEYEWDFTLATSAMVQDLSRMVVTGDATTPGQFDGLQKLIATGYQSTAGADCIEMDSIVIDYNYNAICPEDGATGVTVNGNAVADGFQFFDLLRSALRRIVHRARNSSYGKITDGDIAIVMPFEWINCLLDCWVCYIKCGRDITRIDSYEARQFRDTLNGGPFGDGILMNIEGFNIPIIAHDWGTITEGNPLASPDPIPDSADIYLLVRSLGGQPVLRGQLNDLTGVARREASRGYSTYDAGRILTWDNLDNMCRQLQAEMRPRLLNRAPWAQVRFQHVVCDNILGTTSVDPLSPFFYATKTAVANS